VTDKPLLRKLIDAVRELQRKTTTPYDVCAAAPLVRPACAAKGPRGGTLITPVHVLFARHYPLTPGSKIAYDWGTRTVTETFGVRVGTQEVDIGVGLLNEPAPDTVTPARYLPWDWDRDLRTDRWGGNLKTPIRAIGVKPTGQPVECNLLSVKDLIGVSGTWEVGDSGQPIFLPFETPILLCCLLYKNAGPSVAHYWKEINNITLTHGQQTMLEGSFS
jgi:hypothetical protein